MTSWIDKSDSRCRFFDGGESTAVTIAASLAELFTCLHSEVVGQGAGVAFDILLLEVNCDTGRLLAAATTAGEHALGIVDGCSLRVQELQDFWYDLLESNPSDSEFSTKLTQRVHELGLVFRDTFIPHLGDLRRSSSPNGFLYRVYGSDPGVAVYEEAF